MQTGLLVFTDFVGIVAFALAGILAAEGKNVDPVGVFVMAFTTAFGGGIVRDLIIDNRPLYWIAHEEYVWVTLLMTAVAPVLMGVCTGVFGGLLRDVFLNRLPMVMSDQQPYASAAFVGGVGLRIVELLRRFRICGGFRGDVPDCCPADDLLVLQLGGRKLSHAP